MDSNQAEDIFPRWVLRLIRTRNPKNLRSGERGKERKTMNPLIQLKSRTLVFLVALTCFALSPGSKAVNPAPDGGYPGG
jgi:hypothetical protein